MSAPGDQHTDDHDTRVSQEVSALSTKLIEAIDKQSALETSNQILKRQNAALHAQAQQAQHAQDQLDALVAENAAMRLELETSRKAQGNAEAEVARLRVEIEDLSESLFDEANRMVKDARIDADNYRTLNAKLGDTLTEKDTTIESLTSELKILKNLLYQLEADGRQEPVRRSAVSTPNPSSESLVSESAYSDAASVSQRDPATLQSQSTMFASAKLAPFDRQIVYSPIYNSLRFDLANFQDFVRFVKFLYTRNSQSTVLTPVDFGVLKETAFFKRLFKEEIEPALALETAPGISYFSRKSFVGALVEGRVIIEPISGVNESFKLTHRRTDPDDHRDKLFAYPKNSPPVATLAACSICGEDRNDILEHSRLYTLKLYAKRSTNVSQHKYDPPASPTPVATALPSENPASARALLEVSHQYSLCNYCLIKIRHICELFAFIRNVNNSPQTKVWNFDPAADAKDDVDLECIKAWFHVTKMRAKIFWARVGIWDINEYTAGPAAVPTAAAAAAPTTPRPEPDLQFRGSVIGTGIVAGNRESFMDSVNRGGAAVNAGRRVDLPHGAVVTSPLATQVQGYFEHEAEETTFVSGGGDAAAAAGAAGAAGATEGRVADAGADTDADAETDAGADTDASVEFIKQVDADPSLGMNLTDDGESVVSTRAQDAAEAAEEAVSVATGPDGAVAVDSEGAGSDGAAPDGDGSNAITPKEDPTDVELADAGADTPKEDATDVELADSADVTPKQEATDVEIVDATADTPEQEATDVEIADAAAVTPEQDAAGAEIVDVYASTPKQDAKDTEVANDKTEDSDEDSGEFDDAEEHIAA